MKFLVMSLSCANPTSRHSTVVSLLHVVLYGTVRLKIPFYPKYWTCAFFEFAVFLLQRCVFHFI